MSKPIDGLSKQQIAVLKGIGDGLSTKEIAECLGISEKTVYYHRMKMNQLLRYEHSASGLTRLALAFGLSTLCLMFCFVPRSAAAQPFLVVSNPAPQVQLAWNAPASGTVSFYNIYFGVGSGQYTNKVSVGNLTNATITLPARGVTFFFAVTDVESHGLESAFSNEVNYTAPNPLAPPTQKPLTVITVLKSTSPTGVFADSGMTWSDTPDQPQTYYKLKIDRGIMLSAASPPMPK